MANKFTRIQTTKDRFALAANTTEPLTMLTGDEALLLAKAGQELIGTNEELIYKYREEFLHIQSAAENGLTSLNMLVEDPNEFGIVATAWGFVCKVQSRFGTKIEYTKNLAATETNTELSNITVDWSKPTKPTVDVSFYRNAGNLVLIEDSTIVVPVYSKIDYVKQQLGLTVSNTTFAVNYTRPVNGTNTKFGQGAVFPITANLRDPYSIPYWIKQGGSGYRVGDVITVYGQNLYGNSPVNNATITVKEVDKFGAVTEYSVQGRSGSGGYGTIEIVHINPYTASTTDNSALNFG